jgi:copper chaperone CopZ
MNKFFFTVVAILALAAFAQAESTVKLSGVHLCCKSCVKGVDKAVGTVSGATAASDMEASTVTITAPDAATAQKAVDALTSAGYFGKSEDPAIKVDDSTGAKDAKVSSLTISGVHLWAWKV